MKGREGSVTERFRKDLRLACERAGKIDLNAPFDGADRYVAADQFFAVDGRFFIVEFKSSKRDLQDEGKKSFLCAFCTALSAPSRIRTLHDVGHFAAWGTAYQPTLVDHIGVYRTLVCCEDILPGCGAVKGVNGGGLHQEAANFIQKVIEDRAGLDAEDFKEYLRWLLQRAGKDTAQQALPIVLYGISYASGIQDKTFRNYDDFSEWAQDALKHKRALDPPPAGSSSGHGTSNSPQGDHGPRRPRKRTPGSK